MSALREIMKVSVHEIVSKPIYWVGIFLIPLFIMLFMTNLMEEGLPTRIPAGLVDKDGTSVSREISQTLSSMQMVEIVDTPESFTAARHRMQEGAIYGYFLIPEDFEADLLAGRQPVITFYTNMTYYVPATLLFKTFKATALFSKAGIAVQVIQSAGGDMLTSDPTALLQPVNITSRPIGNPWLNYGIYLCNSFVPCALQLMIMLMAAYALGEEIKQARSRHLLQMARGSIVRAVAGRILPQTAIWFVIALFMEIWLFKFCHYPMNGSWWWFSLSTLMFVLACQGFAIFIYGVVPNLRLALSVCSLLGILSFSIAAFSFPEQSMYGAVSIFSWIVPTRYNFLIYIDQALNGREIFYSRIWYVAYIIFMLLPFTMLWNIKRAYKTMVYAP